jgi:hypothetical protein
VNERARYSLLSKVSETMLGLVLVLLLVQTARSVTGIF